MTTLVPTKSAGATSPATDMLYVEPVQQMTAPDFLTDLLSAMLTHERCGVHLYRSVAGRTTEPEAKKKYEEFGRETLRHVEILEQVISGFGGNPNYVSFQARAVEGMNSKVLESTFALGGSIDPITQEMAMLDAVFLAETIDHANWATLAVLTQQFPDEELRSALQVAVDEVEEQEDQHLTWAKETRRAMVLQLARP